MNVRQFKCTYAPIRQRNRWDSIDWRKVETWVRKLQVRIAKAAQVQRMRLVKSLQWLLSHSYYARLLAVRRVTTNKGKRTSGIDGVRWSTSRQKMRAVFRLKRRNYIASPLKRIYIPKKNGKKRPLSIPTMHDRAMQALYALALAPVAETWADPNSHGFREGRGCADAIGKCFNTLAQTYAPQWILEGDIHSCFDCIDHAWVLKYIPMDKKILRTWLEAGYIEKDILYPTKCGTPQGGIISPLIANMTLDGMEQTVAKALPTRHQLGCRPAVHVVRYADDFIVTASSRELLEECVRPALREFLAKRGLTLGEEKTRITRIEDGFGFLSQHLRKYNGKLLIRPTRQAVKELTSKASQIIQSHRGRDAMTMIKRLNPVLRGWANYHRHVCSSHAFSYIDDYIFKRLWRWARREHDNKGKKWTRAKYFRHLRGSTWSFFATGTNAQGKKYYLDLHKASRTTIVRHVRIRAEANPYLPEWREYFCQRKTRKYTLGKPRSRVTLSAAAGSLPTGKGLTGA